MRFQKYTKVPAHLLAGRLLATRMVIQSSDYVDNLHLLASESYLINAGKHYGVFKALHSDGNCKYQWTLLFLKRLEWALIAHAYSNYKSDLFKIIIV